MIALKITRCWFLTDGNFRLWCVPLNHWATLKPRSIRALCRRDPPPGAAFCLFPTEIAPFLQSAATLGACRPLAELCREPYRSREHTADKAALGFSCDRNRYRS